jgi:hypothetical protein
VTGVKLVQAKKYGAPFAISFSSSVPIRTLIGLPGPVWRLTPEGSCHCREAGGNRRGKETSCPGIFAIGDVRAGSTKRVAAAVGEGAQVVAALHRYLSAAEPTAR